MGLEDIFGFFPLRLIAERLAEAGFATLRLQYDGTGDSAGRGDAEHRVAAWQASIQSAAELLRQSTQAPIGVVGLRLGALLAASVVSPSAGIDALALWGMPYTGREFLREQRARHAVSVREPSDSPDLTVMGATYSAQTQQDLQGLRVPPDVPHHVPHVLALSRAASLNGARRAFGEPNTSVRIAEAPDLDDMLLSRKVPTRSLDAIVSWFESVYPPGAEHEVDFRNRLETEVIIDVNGVPVKERFHPAGPHRLATIISERLSGPDTDAPALVFVPDAVTPRTGLSRMWVDLARTEAARGRRVLRLDLPGLADSPPRPGRSPYTVVLPEHPDDVADAIKAVGLDANVILVGTCSGAYNVLETAHRIPITGVVAVNPAFSFPTPECPPTQDRRALVRSRPLLTTLFGGPIGRLARRFSPALRHNPDYNWDRWFETAMWGPALARIYPSFPEPLWMVLKRALLQRRPVDVLRRLVAQGTGVVVIAGDPDIQAVTLGARRVLRKSVQPGRFEVVHVPEIDHSGLAEGIRDVVIAEILRGVHSLTSAAPSARADTRMRQP